MVSLTYTLGQGKLMGFSQHHFMVMASGVVSSVSKLVAKKYIQTFRRIVVHCFTGYKQVHLYDLLPLFGFFSCFGRHTHFLMFVSLMCLLGLVKEWAFCTCKLLIMLDAWNLDWPCCSLKGLAPDILTHLKVHVQLSTSGCGDR